MLNGDGEGVLAGKNKVANKKGEDVTKEFVSGAKQALKLAELAGAVMFIGKSKSPSCGPDKAYDGTFLDRLVKGDGITAALFKQNKIEVITEKDIEKSTADISIILGERSKKFEK